jgi:hypothetical protein
MRQNGASWHYLRAPQCAGPKPVHALRAALAGTAVRLEISARPVSRGDRAQTQTFDPVAITATLAAGVLALFAISALP